MKKLSIFAKIFFLIAGWTTISSYAFTNNSPFYLNLKVDGGNCQQQQIAPGQTVNTSGYCGYLVCATNQYDSTQGCEEFSGDAAGTLTQGGYLSYIGISGGTTCTIGATFFPYDCQITSNQLNFSYKVITQTYSATDQKGHQAGTPVTLPQISSYSDGPAYRGINISGMEYDGTFLDALYQHPDIPDMLYFSQQGMNTVRLPIRWEFLISNPGNAVESDSPSSSTVNTMYMDGVYDTVEKYLKSGLTVDLDLHNYMRFCPTGATVGQGNEPTNAGLPNNKCILATQQLPHIWDVLATKFAPLAQQYPHQLIFGLMNEPFTMDEKPDQTLNSKDLLAAEVAAVKVIRAHNITNLILLSGNYWDPLHGWTKSPDAYPKDVANGDVFTTANLKAAGLTDLSNIAIEMHQYFDSNYSGTHLQCNFYQNYQDFESKLSLIDAQGNDLLGNWIKANHMKVFLGEFGAADAGTNNTLKDFNNCRKDVGYMLQYTQEHAYNAAKPDQGGFIGWTAWRANKHGFTGFGAFNYLQQENDYVYGGDGTPRYTEGLGIAPGQGNSLMTDIFSQYLKPAASN